MQIPLVDLKIQYKSLRKEISKKISEIFESGTFIKGPVLEEFETNFAKFVGTKYAIGVASGTDALHLSLMALNIGKGDEVILPANTFIATAYAILYVQAKPVFVDVDPKTYNIDTELIERKISKRTKAIIPVHLYGQPCQMDKILQLAKKYKLLVIEDAAQSHGAVYKGKHVGNFGHAAAFSFYPGKNLGAFGDGGIITTNSIRLANKIKMLREYGAYSKYYFDQLGFNSRLDALQAAILNIKLKYLKRWNKKRWKLAQNYNKFLSNLLQITTPFTGKNISHVFHLYVIRTPQRNQLMKFLQKRGIQTGIHYPLPLHLQKSLRYLDYKKGDFPVAEKISKQVLSLPLYPELSLNQQKFIVESIKKILS